MKRARAVLMTATLTMLAACGGELPTTDESEASVLQQPCCTYHSGGTAIMTPACGNGVAVTLLNFKQLCLARCLPFSYHC